MPKTIEQIVVAEYKDVKHISLREAKKVIENDFAGIVVFLGMRKNMQIKRKESSGLDYTESDIRTVINLYFTNSKSIDEISVYLKLSKVIVRQIISDYTGSRKIAKI